MSSQQTIDETPRPMPASVARMVERMGYSRQIPEYVDSLRYEPISDDDLIDEDVGNMQHQQGSRCPNIPSSIFFDPCRHSGSNIGPIISVQCASIVDGMGKMLGHSIQPPTPPFPTSGGPVPDPGLTADQLIESATGIRDVWAVNAYKEFAMIRKLREKYPFIAMDTEFPGVVLRPCKSHFSTPKEFQYQLVRLNCSHLNLIQLGITMFDEAGRTPPGISTWQFNFKFSLEEGMYAHNSIELLQNSGINFDKLGTDGIEPSTFAEFMLSSGLVLSDDIKWISFHSGYDFGYLLKILTSREIPFKEDHFFESLKTYFPTLYDVKYLMKHFTNLRGGLQDIADGLSVTRLGPRHQAGSDSLVTGLTFFKIKLSNEELFNRIDDQFNGHLFGLTESYASVKEKNSSTSSTSTSSSPLSSPEKD